MGRRFLAFGLVSLGLLARSARGGEEDRAIAAIKKPGGLVERLKSEPSKPVVRVSLEKVAAKDADLAPSKR
jgi:hypothetical protein